MLKVNPRERPTAAQALAMNEIQEKILSFQSNQKQVEIENMLLNTIKVPQALRKLNDVLPRPCYPEINNIPRPPPIPTEERQICSSKENPKEVSPRPTPRIPQPPPRPVQSNAAHYRNYSQFR
jgi:hypothetical protein